MKRSIPIALLMLGSLSIMLPDLLTAQDLAVIGHPGVPDSALEKSRILDYYTGDRQRWSNDEPVIPLDLQEPKDVRKNFYKSLGKSSSRMRSIWMRRKLAGEGEPPESIENERELLDRVADTPGAIGFVRRDSVTDQVKLLAVL